MGLFGKKYLIEHPEKYEKTEREIIALAEKAPFGSHIPSDKYRKGTVSLIACIDCATGELMENPRYLTWNCKDRRNSNIHGIKQFGIYRLKVLFSLPFEAPYGGEVPAGRSLFVTKVIKRNVSEPRLEAILTEYKKPVVIDREWGRLTLDRGNGSYEGSVDFGGTEVDLSLSVDDGADTCNGSMEALEALMADPKEWVKKAKIFLAKEFTENANDWQSGEEDYEPITTVGFAKRITLCCISISEDGDLEFWFDDDDMFFGHTLVAYGTLEDGFTEGNMMG